MLVLTLLSFIVTRSPARGFAFSHVIEGPLY